MSRQTFTLRRKKSLSVLAILLLAVCIWNWKVRSAEAANALMFTPVPAGGATLFVTNTNDSGPGSLRAALITANSDTVGDTIVISATGTITLQSALPAFSERGVVINGPGKDSLDVRRSNLSNVPAFSILVVNEGVTVSLNDLTISHGLSEAGAGINNSGFLTLNNCVVSDSLAQSMGGGIFNNVHGELTLNKSTVTRNEANRNASSSLGGGILNYGRVTINDSNISSNRAKEGGGLYNAYNPGAASIISITNSTIDHNSASLFHGESGGGGILNAGVLTVSTSDISGNGTVSNGGGLLVLPTSGNVTLTDTTIRENVASTGGGGISISPSTPTTGQIKLDRVTISSNFGTDAGGIYNAGNLKLDNCTISSNDGKGITTATNSSTSINQSTITNNVGNSQGGGGIDCSLSAATVYGSIISGNRGISSIRDIKGIIVSNDFNLLGSGPIGIVLKPHDIQATDPKLTALGNYGGNVPTHALLPESPAIDHGPTSNFLPTDARNFPRPVDTDTEGVPTSDIGAFETQRYVVTNTNNSGGGSLREALLTNNSNGGGVITFDIAGDGVHTISPTSNTLLEITRPVYINGYSQPGASRNNAVAGSNATLLIEISGAMAGFGSAGLNVTASDSVIEGLVINGFIGESGISINGTGATKNRVSGNLIGTDATGTLSRPNAYAILITGGSSNIIGTNVDGNDDLSEGNILSGNLNGGVAIFGAEATANVVAGNYVGVDTSGQNALPNIGNGILLNSSSGNVIGGTLPAARNVISGNTQNGISVEGSSTNVLIIGNFIGTNANGTVAIANGAGIHLYNGNNTRIGGPAIGEGNVISGNKEGVIIGSDGAANNSVLGNLIGLAADGLSALGNSGPSAGNGVSIVNSNGNSIGDPANAAAANRIAFNSGRGVYVLSGTANNIRGNFIFDNSSLSIDLGPAGITPNDDGDSDSGANNLQNFPILNSVFYDGFGGSTTKVAGTLNSSPSSTFSLEFFDSPLCNPSGHGEGRTLIGTSNVSTDASGLATFDYNFATANLLGHFVSATATDANGNTSEFSPCLVASSAARSVQFTSSTYSSGESNGVATLTVTRIGTPGGPVTVNYSTANGTATGGAACGSGVDYVNTTGTLSWGNNDLSPKTINVPICNDTSVESSENINVALSDATNGANLGNPATATLTIQDNDDPGQISFASSYSVREGAATATISVTRNAVDGDPVSVQYATTAGGTATGGSSCGANGVNYLNASGTLSWGAGDISPKSFTITVCDNTLPEQDKTVAVSLSNPTGGASLGSTPTTLLNIVDDDHVFTVTNTNDDGPGSLRQALVAANMNQAPDSNHIAFSPSAIGTINLLTALPDLNATIFIHGPRANLLTVARSSAVGTPEFRIFTINGGRTVSIGGLTIRNGLVPNGGGGIYNEGTADIQGCDIEGNTSNSGGGGIANIGTMTINASTVANNVSFNFGNISGGGGIFNFGDLRITNSTISGNRIDPNGHGFGYGGGIFNDGSGPLVLTNSTVTGNTATHAGNDFSFDQPGGGGIYQRLFPDQTVTITNSIVAGNTCPNAPDISGPIVSGDYNLIGNTSSAAITGVSSHNLTNVEARLAPLANNGGPTPTHALLHNSPAIDNGNDQNAPMFDQRGLQRIADSNNDGSEIIDIGAFEVQSSCSMVLVTATVPDATVGTNYQHALEVSGGTPGYIFSVTSGALPNGLALSSEGTLFGTPTQSGNFTFVVTVGDASGCSRQREYTLKVNCGVISIGPVDLPSGTVNSPYPTTSFSVGGGNGLYTFVLQGNLPSGLTFSAGTLSGTPTQDGQFPVDVTATNESDCTATRSYTIQIAPAAPVCAADVTPLLTVIRGGFSQNLVTRRFRQTVTIRNDSPQTIVGPLVYAVDNLSLNASLYNSSGVTACAVPISPYVSISTSAGELLPGQTVTLVLEFTNSNTRQSITYSPRILAGNTR